MCLTSYKTIQGIAVRRFPSSLVMLGYCFFSETPARFLPNRLSNVSCHVFLSCWWDEQGSCPLVSLKSKLEMSSILQSYWKWKVLREAKNGFKYEAVFGFEIVGAEAWNWLRSAMLNLNKSISKAKCFAVQLGRCRPCLASHSVAAMFFTFPAAFGSPVLICWVEVWLKGSSLACR